MANEKCVWTSESVFKLLAEVERKPCLWKKSDPMYMNKHVKNAAFQEIGATLGVSRDNARDKLRNLRTIFMQNHKKATKTRNRAVYQPKWAFYNAMLFMTGEATTVGYTDTFRTEEAVEERTSDDGENSTQFGSNQSTSAISSANSPSAPQSSKRQKRGDNDLASALSSLYKEISKTREKIKKRKGPNEKFATEIVSVLNNIHDENIVKRAKARMRLVLADSMAESARRDLVKSEPISRTPSPISQSS